MKNNVPVLVQAVNDNSYWMKSIFAGLRKSAERREYALEFINSADCVTRSDYFGISSIIVCGYTTSWLESTLSNLLKKNFNPIVVNAGLSHWMLKYCNGISFALEESIEHSIQYLASVGRQSIALLGINKNSLADCLKENTFTKKTNEMFNISKANIFYGDNSLFECVDGFINTFTEGKIDAVICANDTVAIYLINRMLEDGFNIPEDLYIIGMGNSRLGQNISIPLTSVDFDYEELGRQAIEQWRYIQKGNDKIHINISVPCRIIIRETTGDIGLAETKYSLTCIDNLSDKNIKTDVNAYYEDADVQKIIKFETFLKTCDSMDFRILEGLSRGKNDFMLTESLNMSDRAIRYRISKMAKKLGVRTREEIVNIISDMRAFE